MMSSTKSCISSGCLSWARVTLADSLQFRWWALVCRWVAVLLMPWYVADAVVSWWYWWSGVDGVPWLLIQPTGLGEAGPLHPVHTWALLPFHLR